MNGGSESIDTTSKSVHVGISIDERSALRDSSFPWTTTTTSDGDALTFETNDCRLVVTLFDTRSDALVTWSAPFGDTVAIFGTDGRVMQRSRSSDAPPDRFRRAEQGRHAYSARSVGISRGDVLGERAEPLATVRVDDAKKEDDVALSLGGLFVARCGRRSIVCGIHASAASWSVFLDESACYDNDDLDVMTVRVVAYLP